jgi:hypothetical protein
MSGFLSARAPIRVRRSLRPLPVDMDGIIDRSSVAAEAWAVREKQLIRTIRSKRGRPPPS